MISALRNLFFPHHKNNHRSKLLHNSSLFVLVLFFLFANSATFFVSKSYPEVLGITYSISEQELLTLVNNERVQKGLSPLKLNGELSSAAKGKALHMFANNYWAHFAPDGTSPWTFIRGSGYNYLYAGENLAKGFTTSETAVKAWMNSPSHRENILSSNFKEVGFGVSEGNLQGEETVLIVEMFGSKSEPLLARQEVPPVPTTAEQPVLAPESNEPVQGTVGARPIINTGTLKEIRVNPVIDLILGSKAITFVILASLLMALLIDFIIVEKKKIPRIVGNNIDHIILILLFAIFIIIAGSGKII